MRAQRGACKGPAHKNPGGPTRAWPMRAQEAHKGLAHKGPRGPQGPGPWALVKYIVHTYSI